MTGVELTTITEELNGGASTAIFSFPPDPRGKMARKEPRSARSGLCFFNARNEGHHCGVGGPASQVCFAGHHGELLVSAICTWREL